MTHSTSARTFRCADCGGHPVVYITTGLRHRDGTRATLRVTCEICRGTGVVSVPDIRHATAPAGW